MDLDVSNFEFWISNICFDFEVCLLVRNIMVTDYFFVYSSFFQCEEKIVKNFWDMEIIGNRRKNPFFTVMVITIESYWIDATINHYYQVESYLQWMKPNNILFRFFIENHQNRDAKIGVGNWAFVLLIRQLIWIDKK